VTPRSPSESDPFAALRGLRAGSWPPRRGLAGSSGGAAPFLRGCSAALIAVALAGSRAAAHDFWLEPSSYTPDPGAEIIVAIKVGVPFHGDPVPRMDRSIRRFVLLDRRGATPVPGVPGADPAGRIAIGAVGTALVGYVGAPAANSVDAETFEAYLRERGLDAVAQARAQARTTREPASEIFSRCAKAILRVGGAWGGAAEQALGCRFELFLEELDGQAAVFRAFFEGKPVAGIKLIATSQQGGGTIEARTAPDGRARLRLRAPGPWLASAVHMNRAPANSGAEWESIWASISFAADGITSRAARGTGRP